MGVCWDQRKQGALDKKHLWPVEFRRLEARVLPSVRVAAGFLIFTTMQKRKVDLGITAMFVGLALIGAICVWAAYTQGLVEGKTMGVRAAQSWFDVGVEESRSMVEHYGCDIPAWEWEAL